MFLNISNQNVGTNERLSNGIDTTLSIIIVWYQYYYCRILSWTHGCNEGVSVYSQFHMNLSLQEVNHIIKSLETMSQHDVARAREMIAPGVTNHSELIQKLKDYRFRLT